MVERVCVECKSMEAILQSAAISLSTTAAPFCLCSFPCHFPLSPRERKMKKREREKDARTSSQSRSMIINHIDSVIKITFKTNEFLYWEQNMHRLNVQKTENICSRTFDFYVGINKCVLRFCVCVCKRAKWASELLINECMRWYKCAPTNSLLIIITLLRHVEMPWSSAQTLTRRSKPVMPNGIETFLLLFNLKIWPPVLMVHILLKPRNT